MTAGAAMLQTMPAADAASAVAPDAGPIAGAGRILAGVFGALDRAGISYCVLHGYDDYPARVTSDVDCLIDPGTSLTALHAVLREECARLGALIVRANGHHIVIAGSEDDGSVVYLDLDLATDVALDGRRFYRGAEILRGRRRFRTFWIPAPDVELGCRLVRAIAGNRLDEARTSRIAALYRQDPAGCRRHVERFFGPAAAELIIAAAQSNTWQDVREAAPTLRHELIRTAGRRDPTGVLACTSRRLAVRMRCLLRPEGLSVVFLGPDGAGKSSTIDAVGPQLDGAFRCWTYGGFAPSIRHLLGKPRGATDRPHALPARSVATSVARAGYWLVYYTFSHLALRATLARATLVLNDRHFVDILVDPKRYRYGGPTWLVRLIARCIPKPDLIIALDAAPEILQARKQEVPFEVTARQRNAYLALVQGMDNGRVVDAGQPPARVAAAVRDLILRHLAARIAARRG